MKSVVEGSPTLKERQFLEMLRGVFIGARLEGQSGFINLMQIKSRYFDVVFSQILGEIQEKTKEFPDFKDEMFEKLYTFFKTYFSETGSIYFSNTSLKSKIYEKIYSNDEDVSLFWKTHMLYYVKTERLWHSMGIEPDKDFPYRVAFDVSKLEHQKANEKKEIMYELSQADKNEIKFNVLYSERNRKTRTNEILTELKKKGIKLDEDNLEEIFRKFEMQNEVDYFINKDARSFLKEQFDLWLMGYLLDIKTEFTERRLKQIQLLKETAYKIIDFAAQFEDELVKIWNKPKFVLKSNYVITLDRIADKKGGTEVIDKIIRHEGFQNQVEEWKELGFLQTFDKEKLYINKLDGKELSDEYRFLPIDTKHFDKDIKLDILSLFDNLDDELDGWLIHSENYQALRTILPKFREKVQTIYIDPPFNKEQDADYYYKVKYKDSTWITMLENRLQLAEEFLKGTGCISVRCDYNGNMYVRLLMNEIFGEENFINEISINRTLGKKKIGESFPVNKDSIFLFSKSEKFKLKEIEKPLEQYAITNSIIECLTKKQLINEEVKNEILNMLWVPLDHRPGERTASSERVVFGKKFYPPEGRHWIKSQAKLDQLEKLGKLRLRCAGCGHIHYRGKWTNCPVCKKDNAIIEIFLDSEVVSETWLDIPGYSQTWKFQTENSEILLKRIIESTSDESDIVMDFFLGSGTTTAVAHKLRRKWIGVEMGGHFYSVVLPRMKKVLFYDKSGISKEKDVKEKYNEKSAGGFFKYYELEQYEQTLRKVKYTSDEPFKPDNDTLYYEYMFMKDAKLLDAVKLDFKKNKIVVDLKKIYPEVDVAETISNLTGKKIEKGAVVLEDGQRIEFDKLDFNMVKPLIWWQNGQKRRDRTDTTFIPRVV